MRLELANNAWRAELAEAPDAIIDVARRVVETNQAIHVPEIAVARGGRPAYYAATVHPLRGCLGAATGAIVVCAEVTDRVIAQRLGVARAALIWSGVLGGGADFANGALRSYAGDEWSTAVHADDSEAVATATQQAADEIEIRLRRADGDYRWFRVGFKLGPDGTRWFACASDIHDARAVEREISRLLASARAARAEAEQANRLKDQFLATLSHELRAPLTTMLLWEKLLRDDPQEPIRTQALDAIRQSALAQARMVGDLLDVSRAIAGKLFVDRRPLLLRTVVADALEAASPAALAKGLTLSCSGSRLGHVDGDVARLRQVLDNVLANAVKFTEPGGRIEVMLRRDAGTASIMITDTGRGIAPDYLERIFVPFHQADDLLARRDRGLGLGLAISRQLVELHGGTLTASSDGLGCGATLKLELPLSRRRRSARLNENVDSAALLRHKRILVIDDDERVRDALSLLLERAGAVVYAADSAAHGREVLETESPDVIVCDIAMPGEDGHSFVRTLRRLRIRIPTIALTAHALPADATLALDAGFDIHLAKPVSFEWLVTSIAALLRRSPHSDRGSAPT
ncbi:MAG TPA: ATP-binding protein [Kofleriaceae bacterium]|nr:ATP-binding protein [Kofleriaceae bacterium]